MYSLREKGLKPKMTTHLEIDKKNGINCTTGSLGHGLQYQQAWLLLKRN